MRALILFVCLAVGCLAQEPQPCRSPALLTGQLSVSSPQKKLMAFAKYSYDALGERIRIREIGHYGKKTFHHDVLLHYRQRVMYKINYRNHTCCKKRLCVDFHPLAIPRNSTLLAQVVLGSSSGPGEGVLVNTWLGELHMKKEPANYMSTVTEFGCVPVSTVFHSNRTGWVVTSFFNNVIGLTDPQQLLTPAMCKHAQLEEEDGEEPESFFSLF